MCDLCAEAFDAGKELKSKDLALLCTHCWDAARERNEKVPARVRGKRARLTRDEQKDLFHHATHALMASQERARARWDIGSDAYKRWDFDPDALQITFSQGPAAPVVADVALLGTYELDSKTFSWSWHTYEDRDHPLVGGLAYLEGFGEVRGIKKLEKAVWKCDRDEGWAMSALAAYLFTCETVYRATASDGVDQYLLLNNIRLTA